MVERKRVNKREIRIEGRNAEIKKKRERKDVRKEGNRERKKESSKIKNKVKEKEREEMKTLTYNERL